jgi:NDP-sugar pyrophosphorylase family protein
MNYRNISESEISSLKNQGCNCSDWSKIQVAENFNPANVRNVNLSGNITLGLFEKTVCLPGDIEKPSGIYNSSLHNCNVGNDVYISNVNALANYEIENDVQIENVQSIIVNGKSSFGNGVELEILNEGGGRNLKIFENLSAQIAYLMVMYRHNKNLIEQLEKMIDEFTASKTLTVGKIGEGASIKNCNTISNVNVGAYATISGAAKLENGTIVSKAEAPTYIGNGVTAINFIIHTGTKIENFALLDKCFVGQGVQMGKQYSAENSAFFANCEGFHGEAVSLFAGPYMVTHHKSTLLIAGLFSFFNAGSGSNQSNHMYKLGPLHQGILERGSKTGSFSYMLWESRVGAFSAVIGKHYTNFDASNFPFSYLNEESGKTVLTPAMNLLTVGTKRDSEKWPARDRRKDPVKLDLISFDLFSPFTVGKMVKGSKILQNLYETASKEREYITTSGMHINRLMLKTSTKYYEMGIKIFLGKCLINKLKDIAADEKFDELKEKLAQVKSEDKSEWIDVCGLLAPSSAIQNLVNEVADGKLNDVEKLQAALSIIHKNYDEAEWGWCVDLIESRLGKKINELTKEDFIHIIKEWKENSIKLNHMIAKDAQREFDPFSKISFGIDGTAEERDKDFEAVRGSFEGNKFVKQLENENKATEEKAGLLINLVGSLK